MQLGQKLFLGALCVGSSVLTGCGTFRGDPCWPDRYTNEARKLHHAYFEPQVMNGHILDQTIWNEHFERGTEKLTLGGQDKLDQLARRRPAPDGRIFLQTTRDIGFEATKPEEYITKRNEIDSKRVAAIQQYLNSSMAGRNSQFDIQIHDPAPPGIAGAEPRVIIPSPRTRATGTGTGAGAAGAAGPGGASGAPPAASGSGTPPAGGGGMMMPPNM